MNDIFSKWPNWVRWITSIPLSFLAVFLFSLINKLTVLRFDIDISSGFFYYVEAAIEIFIFFGVLYMIIPKYKFITCMIVGFLWFALMALCLIMYIGQGNVSRIILSIVIMVSTIAILIAIFKQETSPWISESE